MGTWTRSADTRQEWIDALEARAGCDIAGNAARIDGCSTRNALLSDRRVLVHTPAFSAGSATIIITADALRMKLLAREDRAIGTLAELVASAVAREVVAFAVVGTGLGTGLLWKALASDWVVSFSTGAAGGTDVSRRAKARAGSTVAVAVGLARTVVLAVVVSRADHSGAPSQSIIGGKIHGGQRMGFVSSVHNWLGRNVRVDHLTDEATLIWAERLVDVLGSEDAIGVGAGDQ